MEERDKIGRGELESIAVCMKRGFPFASFDKRASSIAKNPGVDVIPAGAIFKGLMINYPWKTNMVE